MSLIRSGMEFQILAASYVKLFLTVDVLYPSTSYCILLLVLSFLGLSSGTSV